MAASEGWWSDTRGLAEATGPEARGMGTPICVSVCIMPFWLTVLERRAQHFNSRQFLQDGEPIHGPCRQVITIASTGDDLLSVNKPQARAFGDKPGDVH